MDEDLKNLAELALKTAREELNRNGTMVPAFMVRGADDTLGIIRLEGDAGNAMNSGEAKDVIFGAVRMMVKARNLTGVIFISECWLGQQTAKGAALSEAEFYKRTREKAFATAVKDGIVERCEAIALTVQTPAGTLIVQQIFTRDYNTKRVEFGKRLETELGPDEFRGRQKMYGDLREEYLG